MQVSCTALSVQAGHAQAVSAWGGQAGSVFPMLPSPPPPLPAVTGGPGRHRHAAVPQIPALPCCAVAMTRGRGASLDTVSKRGPNPNRCPSPLGPRHLIRPWQRSAPAGETVVSAGGGSAAVLAAGGVRRGRGRSRCAAPGAVHPPPPPPGQAQLLPAPSCAVERSWAGAPHSRADPRPGRSPAAREGVWCTVFDAQGTHSAQCSVQPSSPACDGAAQCPPPQHPLGSQHGFPNLGGSLGFPRPWASRLAVASLPLAPAGSGAAPALGERRQVSARQGQMGGLGVREGWRPPS